MLENLQYPEIKALIDAQDFSKVEEVFHVWPPADLAAVINQCPEAEQAYFFKHIPANQAVRTFEYLDPQTQTNLLLNLSQPEITRILNEMSADDRTTLLEGLPEEVREQVLKLLFPAERVVAESLLEYPEDSIGRHMTPDFIAVKKEWSIKEVLEHIRTHGQDRETLNVIYVVDEQYRLVDDLRIREILLAQPERLVKELIDRQFVALNLTDDHKTAIDMFRKYDRVAFPVIDEKGILVGIVTVDDFMDIAEEEATKELQRFGGMEVLEEPYIDMPLLQMVKKRATWLVVLFVGEMLTTTAMSYFQTEISRAVILALFIPLIISSGGNSGAQAATLIIRALAVGEVKLKDWFHVMRREICAGFCLGSILGLVGFLRIYIWNKFSNFYGPHGLLIAITVGVTLIGVVMWGTIAGSMLPLVLKRLGFDPATSSAPFVATMVDVTGLVIYFSVAFVILNGTLL